MVRDRLTTQEMYEKSVCMYEKSLCRKEETQMKYYLAPLEGTTGRIYRNAVQEFFPGTVDKFFTPFIVPHPKKALSPRETADILPENNPGITLVPQILTSSAREYLRFEAAVRDMGYEEININLGCPSGTVTKKGRGAGALASPDALDALLDDIYSHAVCRVSVKTRIGVHDPREWPALLEIYNRYPVHELIVHPRVSDEMYRGTVHMQEWEYAVSHARAKLCYNGDIRRPDLSPYAQSTGAFRDDNVGAIMLGRGMIADPSLIRQIKGGAPASYEELRGFMGRLRENYLSLYGSDHNVLHRLKEIWAFMGADLKGCEPELKTLMKATSLDVYKVAEARILRAMR